MRDQFEESQALSADGNGRRRRGTRHCRRFRIGYWRANHTDACCAVLKEEIPRLWQL